MLGEQLLVDARLVVVAVQVGLGDQRHQVAVAGLVLGQQDHVVGVGVDFRFLVAMGARCNVGLDADDRLDARRAAGLVELDRPVHRPVVGDAQAGHAQVRGPSGQRPDPAQAVEKAEFRVDVEVDEVVRGLCRHWPADVLAANQDAARAEKASTRGRGGVSPDSNIATCNAGPWASNRSICSELTGCTTK